MKKIIIANFFAFLMLMIPITSAVQTVNIHDIKNISVVNEEIKFYITNNNYYSIISFIENKIPQENKSEAYDILDEIVTPNQIYGYEVDMPKLAQVWGEHGYKSINKNDIDNAITLEDLETLLKNKWVFDAIGELVIFITTLQPIKNRLGWFHRVINDGYYFCKEGVFITLDITVDTLQQLQALANVVNFIVSVPETLYKSIDDLFNNRIPEFKNKISGLINDFFEVTIGIIPYAKDLLDAFVAIFDYLTSLLNFILDMLTATPWNDPIQVHGTLLKNFPGSVKITCRGQFISFTQGEFNFNVDPNPDNTSIPEDVFYGIHNCQITVEQDGKILSQSTKILSYVFSGGSIYWPFVIIKARSRYTNFNSFLMEKINNLLILLNSSFRGKKYQCNSFSPRK